MSAWLDSVHFLRPAWLLALLGLPLLPWLWRERVRAKDPWRRICDAHLLAHLRSGTAGRQARWGGWPLALGYLLAILALAGPALRMLPQEGVRSQSPLIVAVDLSDRMRATDLKPDRISRVRYKLADLLQRRADGQTALIAWAGDAFVVAPLTDDAASLSLLAAALSPDVMPIQGQRLDRAIRLAQQLLHDAGQQRGDLLVLTDHADTRAIRAAAEANAAGLDIFVLGVGTPAGAPIPRAQGGFMLDQAGAILLPGIDAPSLRQLASVGNGRFAGLTSDAADLQALGVLESRLGADFESSQVQTLDWRDEGAWLLLPLLPLAALLFRRGALFLLAGMLVLPVAPVQAADGSALWQRADQRAWQALQDGDHERAGALARDGALAGAAAYRKQDYDTAIEAFSRDDDATAHYNRGNALARAGRYEEAIAAYDEALARQSDFPDASANRQAVQDWLDRPREEQPQGGGEGSGSAGEGASSDAASGADSSERGEAEEDADGSPPPEDQTGDDEQGATGAEDDMKGDEQAPDAADDSAADEADRGADSGAGGPGEADEPELPEPDAVDEDAQGGAEEFEREMREALQQRGDEPDGGEGRVGMARSAEDIEAMEEQQRMEQLLQRVPDDPGGLLRRKFQLEFQRRQQEGRVR